MEQLIHCGSTPRNSQYYQRKRILFGFGVASLCCLFAALLAGKAFSPAEGWYSYYAYLINEQGAIPYVDFELLFPPLYVYIIAAFTRIFGYQLIALRIFGVVIYTATGLLLYLIFEKLTKNPFFAFLAGAFSVAVLQSEVVQIFYDYIRFMDISVYASIYFFLCYFSALQPTSQTFSLKPDRNLLLGTFFAVCASLFKQSSGLIYLFFCFAVIIYTLIVLPNKKQLLFHFATMVALVVFLYAAMFIILLQKGSLGAYFQQNFRYAAHAKGGSILTILFGWVPRSLKKLGGGFLFATSVFAVWLLVFLFDRRFRSDKGDLCVFEKIASVAAPAFLLLDLLLAFCIPAFLYFNSSKIRTVSMFGIFWLSFFLFVALAICPFFRKKQPQIRLDARFFKYLFCSGAAFALAFAVCTSGGLAESQIALGYPIVFSLFLPYFRFPKKEIAAGFLTCVMLFQTAFAWNAKINEMNTWWGLSVGNFYEQNVTCSVPLLAGIRMNRNYATMYENVYAAVNTYTSPEDEIFVFPHIPILYLLTDRPRASKTAVQWFDVSTDEAVLADIQLLAEKKPRLMVLCPISEYVSGSHETLFRGGAKSGLSQMQEALSVMIQENGYICLSSDKICEGYTIEIWLLPD